MNRQGREQCQPASAREIIFTGAATQKRPKKHKAKPAQRQTRSNAKDLVKLSVSTMYRWMRKLGFRYEVRKKCYYVDTHEKPENCRYRKQYAREYRQLELRMHRWIQFKQRYFVFLQDTAEFKKHKLVSNGYKYHSERNGPMIELHVDDHPFFQQKMNKPHHIFGGDLSIHNPNQNRPLIAFGQDECIFKQFLFTTKAWVAPDGTKSLVLKDEGLGVMISAFVSREFGLGMKLSAAQLAIINVFR
jgi:hypothetical protein